MKMDAKILKAAANFTAKSNEYPQLRRVLIEEHVDGTYSIVATDTIRMFYVNAVWKEEDTHARQWLVDLTNPDIRKKLNSKVVSFSIENPGEINLFDKNDEVCDTIATETTGPFKYVDYRLFLPKEVAGCSELISMNPSYLEDGVKAITTLCGRKSAVVFGISHLDKNKDSESPIILQPHDVPAPYKDIKYILMPMRFSNE